MKTQSYQSIVVALFLFLSGCATSPFDNPVNQRGSDGLTPLQRAIVNNQKEKALQMVENPDVVLQMKSRDRRTALDYSFDMDDTTVRNAIIRKHNQTMTEAGYEDFDNYEIQTTSILEIPNWRKCEILENKIIELANDPIIKSKIDLFTSGVCKGMTSLQSRKHFQRLAYLHHDKIPKDSFSKLTSLNILSADERFYNSMKYNLPDTQKFFESQELLSKKPGPETPPIVGIGVTYVFDREDDRDRLKKLGHSTNMLTQIDWDAIACAAIFEGPEQHSNLNFLVNTKASKDLSCFSGNPIKHAIDTNNNVAIRKLSTLGYVNRISKKQHEKYLRMLINAGNEQGFLTMLSGRKERPHPALIADYILKTKSDQILHELTRNEKHAVGCELLKSPLSSELQIKTISQTIIYDKTCTNGEHPIFVANTSEAFSLIYSELYISPSKESQKGINILQKAIRIGDPDLIKAVAEDNVTLVNQLGARDAVLLPNNNDLIQKLEEYGMSSSYSQIRSEISICHKFPFRKYSSSINQKFFDAYRDIFNKYKDDDELRDIALDSYIACLKQRKSQVAEVSPFRKHDKERPEISSDIYTEAKIDSLIALSMLAYSKVNDIDAIFARDLLHASYGNINDKVDLFRAEVKDYYNFQKSELERRYLLAKKKKEEGEQRAIFGTLIAAGVAVASSAFLDSQGVDSSGMIEQSTSQLFSQYQSMQRMVDKNYRDSIQSLNQVQFDIPEIDVDIVDKLDSDGIRLFVPRYGYRGHHGSLESHPSYDPTNSTVRLLVDFSQGVGRVCTATIIGSGRLLTAKSCVVDGPEMNTPKQIVARFEYLGVDDGSSEVFASRYGDGRDEGWTIMMPPGHFNPGLGGDWKNDWAILQSKHDKRPHLPRSFVDRKQSLMNDSETRAYLNSKGRITLVGYAGHLNEGRFLTMDWGCQIRAAKAGKILTRCKGWAGDAGAGISVVDGQFKGKIIAVHSFSNQSSENLVSGAVSSAHVLQELDAGRYKSVSL